MLDHKVEFLTSNHTHIQSTFSYEHFFVLFMKIHNVRTRGEIVHIHMCMYRAVYVAQL